jgi:hypothetical protein
MAGEIATTDFQEATGTDISKAWIAGRTHVASVTTMK